MKEGMEATPERTSPAHHPAHTAPSRQNTLIGCDTRINPDLRSTADPKPTLESKF